MKKLKCWPVFISLCVGLLVACAPAPTAVPEAESANSIATATAAELDTTIWHVVAPGGETGCALDTPYKFWVRQGTSNRAMIYFQGGGGCYDAATCGSAGGYKQTVEDHDNPAVSGAGVLDFEHPDNPFKDDHILFIPYCTGDVHAGNRDADYAPINGDPFQIQHRGHVNASAALDWLYARVPDPEAVFVTGCSAGAIGSILHTPHIAAQYPDARLAQLGDSGGGLTSYIPWNIAADYDASSTLPDWIPTLQTEVAQSFTVSAYTVAVANYYPQHKFAQYNAAADRIQARYYAADGGAKTDFPAALQESLSDVSTTTDNFASFTAAGERHCILNFPAFYDEAQGDVSLLTWVTDLAHGQAVETVGPDQ